MEPGESRASVKLTPASSGRPRPAMDERLSFKSQSDAIFTALIASYRRLVRAVICPQASFGTWSSRAYSAAE